MVNFLKFLSARRLLNSQPRVPQAASATVAPLSPTASSASPSQLLNDVLGEVPTSNRASQGPEGRQTAVPPLSQRLSVGARLADAKHIAIETAVRLSGLVDEDTAEMLAVIIKDLESRVCRIAFVGQMNAGKSSLINVLVEQAELLPADINPWTTVITNLHFGVPGAPVSGASFTFFSLDEWRRLSVGGRTRELTERLFPDFDWQELNSQIEAMRKRAEQKLGPRFEALLGTEQAYPAITPGLLNRYVGAGQSEAAGTEAELEGEFSDITKQANAFFDLGAFNFPTILIDTPGVNDPFLVRDEITRQSLQTADICVVVLTARQPLSTADLSLLRMLRGLNKNRLIIFINKIDEIEGGDDVFREVSHRVQTVLKQEFPSAHVPVVFGSALWARKALFPRLFGDEAAHPEAEDLASTDWPSASEISNTVIAETFFLKSGLSSLAVSVSELMRAGTVAEAVDSAKTLIAAVCRNSIACLEIEISALSKSFADLRTAKNEASALAKLGPPLSAEFDAYSERLAHIYMRQVTALHQSLVDTIHDFISESLAEKTTVAQLSQIDLRLRVKLENTFSTAFESAADSVFAEQERLQMEVARLLEGSSLMGKLTLAVSGRTALSSPPSLAALSEPAAFSLTASFEELASKRLQSEDQNAYLSGAIIADFEPIAARLADEAARALNDMSANLIQQMRTLTLRPLLTAIRETSTRLEDIEAASAAGHDWRPALERELEAKREKISELKLVLAASNPADGTRNQR
jgi:GTP-binding protein EngB required for normal cell division